ncbi:hypothetical protein EV356DRAFT_216997 [Viridothelium virens]|uniref:Uncharacterized protein n=1 Tax=Viridothelium virens TaxID=1048519 RepID=A0A6A6H5S1_VIRVR|nr:hypothetical protein EV356DRAFT_216997 [Viridothelium virens]
MITLKVSSHVQVLRFFGKVLLTGPGKLNGDMETRITVWSFGKVSKVINSPLTWTDRSCWEKDAYFADADQRLSCGRYNGLRRRHHCESRAQESGSCWKLGTNYGKSASALGYDGLVEPLPELFQHSAWWEIIVNPWLPDLTQDCLRAHSIPVQALPRRKAPMPF